MIRYLHYPGCSLEATAHAYNDSVLTVAWALGLELDEIRDWNCCGATEYFGISLTPAYALIARNLALAAKQGNGARTVVAPCSACYLNLAKCDHYMSERPALARRVNEALGAADLRYEPGSVAIRHILDVLVRDVGIEAIRRKVVRPLTGLRVAPYLGCMVPRPDYEGRWSDAEHPNELDRVLRALGAEVIDFPLKAHCCGGHMPHIEPKTAFELIRRLVASAAAYDADVMATVCPMCQLNVDAYQGEANRHFGTHYKVPIVFFTQLMALAFGFEPAQVGFGTEFVSTEAALARVGVSLPPPAETPKPRTPRRDDKSLPMPSKRDEED